MRTIEGTLESYGPSVEALGGMRYSYVRISHDNGRITNVANIIAFTNVAAELNHLIDQENRRIKLHCKGGLFIYALEHDGVIISDYNLIFNAWLTSLFWTFGPFTLGVVLVMSRDQTLALGGIAALLIGCITFIKWFAGCILFWPSFQAVLQPSASNRAN
ncbi:hypothetical protein [Microvirga flavescens]|uniref:hypothetical protein n=1 Tax=Microvirga flavescens TaxID=2249811 RepID=UPI000DD746C2|nr:hypothetical protein [Microvirga flavescens]